MTCSCFLAALVSSQPSMQPNLITAQASIQHYHNQRAPINPKGTSRAKARLPKAQTMVKPKPYTQKPKLAGSSLSTLEFLDR